MASQTELTRSTPPQRRALQPGSDGPGADAELLPSDLPAGFALCERIDRNRKPV
ncbi:hypothetical protein OG613_44815 (plasmid) [Streptomyces sp. NBC_00015]|uniref:hypothetical protein n=1 Tax=Streptomyces sp. NBC_00015 TaxID=2903611 RepID=UPI002F9173BC